MLLKPTRRRDPVYRLIPRTAPDSYGDPVLSWADPDKDEIPGATWEDITSEEDANGNRRLVNNTRQLFVPGRGRLTQADRVEIRGEVWRIDGNPIDREGMALGVYTVAKLTRVTGDGSRNG
jgi:hypothetical protein